LKGWIKYKHISKKHQNTVHMMMHGNVLLHKPINIWEGSAPVV